MNDDRRRFLAASALGISALPMSGLMTRLAAAADAANARACIVLWMSGGPSQLDTLDPKPDHDNGGEFAAISTAVPGIEVCEHLPGVAQQMRDIALVRSMATKEGDHSRATYLGHTGRLPAGAIDYPTLGSFVSEALPDRASDLPPFVAISPNRFLSPRAFAPGFLGSKVAPLVVGDVNIVRPVNDQSGLQVANLSPSADVDAARMQRRLELLRSVQGEFRRDRPDAILTSHASAYEKAVRMMQSDAAEAFDTSGETPALRDRYGRNLFGEGCLVARRLVERGVKFVEVSLNGVDGNNSGVGWDTHQRNFEAVRNLCGVLDPAWATLLADLRDRGLLDSTLVVWMGEFGRTPMINDLGGRDHSAVAWSTALCGGGIRGGQVIGRTSDDGTLIEDRPVTMADFHATVCRALRVDPAETNMSNVGRPIPRVELEAEPLDELLM